MNKIMILLALLAAAPSAWAGNGFKAMAKEISKAAKKAGMERVAVLSFVPADGSGSSDGWSLSEKLTTQVVRTGLQTVERSLLKKLMEEHQLGQTGILEQAAVKQLAKVFAVEGLVTGSFVTMGTDMIVQVRLINVESGLIVMASEGRIPREWFDSIAKDTPEAYWVPVPRLTVEAPAFPAGDLASLRDAVANDSCVDAEQKVDDLNRQILDLKARYWALRLQGGMSMADLTHNPGSEITDSLLKKDFYARIRSWLAHETIPQLSPSEIRRFISFDSKAFGIHGRCRA